MLKKIGLALVLTSAVGCGSLKTLAADEKAAASYLRTVSIAADSGQSAPTITQANDEMLALDPSSATLQRIHSAIAAAIAAGDLGKIVSICTAAAGLLDGIADITAP